MFRQGIFVIDVVLDTLNPGSGNRSYGGPFGGAQTVFQPVPRSSSNRRVGGTIVNYFVHVSENLSAPGIYYRSAIAGPATPGEIEVLSHVVSARQGA